MNKTLKYGLIGGGSLAVVAVAILLYLYFMPHPDIQSEIVDMTITADELVNDFLKDTDASNKKYLDKIVVVTGIVAKIEEDQLKQKVVLLKTESSGVNCTFMIETNKSAEKLNTGDNVKIKGIVRLGASYDEDLDMSEYAIIEKCDVIK